MDKGIIFSGPMVQALLDGRKTQTRRLCAWANNPNSPQLTYIVACDEPGWFGDEEGEAQFQAGYTPGDRLYVREAHAIDGERIWYRLGHEEARAKGPRVDVRWRPSIHMPRKASRITLLVSEVRVQRLQDISEADAMAEGIYEVRSQAGDGMRHFGTSPNDSVWPTAARAYRTLWDTLHTEEGRRWQDNPWIIAVTFEVKAGNIDTL